MLLTVTLNYVKVTLDVCLCVSALARLRGAISEHQLGLSRAARAPLPEACVSTQVRLSQVHPSLENLESFKLPWSISSTQEHPRSAVGSLWKCLGVTLYKCCLFVITCFLFLPKHTSSLLACICTLLRIYLINSLLGCLSLLRCGHSTGILVLLRLFIHCKYGVFVGNVGRGVI